MMYKSSARFQPKRGRRSGGLRQPERRIKAKLLQYNGIHPSSSGVIDLRISSSCSFTRNESLPNNSCIFTFAIDYDNLLQATERRRNAFLAT
ncbi:unnamed protein product [Protopolystoma xenopodis]|uniref:Uncharacterized protein n=1 Tax=Protopolystoma xenopodis TaxID=117903 RepID=A0A448WCK4_9PLAT|nr:unnamed protein product [Protopolystoma xenopodis]